MKTPTVDGTAGFIGYLRALLDEQVIEKDGLRTLIDGIRKRNEIANPIPHEVTSVDSKSQIHYVEIEEYIHQTHLDQKKILAWALAALKGKDRIHEEREKARLATQDSTDQDPPQPDSRKS